MSALAGPAVQAAAPLILFGAALVMGQRAQRAQLGALGQDPAALSRSGLAQALEQMRKIIHFLDLQAFNSFILITFILILVFFFFDHPPGYLTLLLLAGLLGYNLGRGLAAPARKTMPRVLGWLGQTYLRQEKWDDLEFILRRLGDYPATVEKIELAWMQAHLALHHRQPDKAVAVLSALPASPRSDPLLIRLLLEAGDRDAAEQRLGRHRPDQALTILKSIPAGPDRDQALISRLVPSEDWAGIADLTRPLDPQAAAELLAGLPASAARDDLLLPALARAGDFDRLMTLAAGYGAEEGEARLRRVIPPGPELGQAVIALHGGLGNFGQVRKYLAGAPLERVIPILLSLPPSDERDLILFELWIKQNDLKAPAERFDPFAPERPIAILRRLPPGPARDRLLGYYSAYAGDLQAVVDCLEKHLPAGILTADEGRALAQAYAKLGLYEKIEPALHLTGAKDDDP